MATHINNICVRNYVKVDGKGRRLVPTELGLSLVKGYKAIDPDLVAPDLRGNIERSVDGIAKVAALLTNTLTKHKRMCIYRAKLIIIRCLMK